MRGIPNLWLFAKFALVGGFGLCIVLALTYVLTDVFHLWYFFSFIVSTGVAWTFVFFTNATLTFDSKSSITLQKYAAFISGYLVLFCVNAAIVYILTSLVGVFYEISILAGTGLTTLLTFGFSRTFIFTSAPASHE